MNEQAEEFLAKLDDLIDDTVNMEDGARTVLLVLRGSIKSGHLSDFADVSRAFAKLLKASLGQE